MAGRVVRGIGALGSANVFRGAIALFQRIQHPWKDRLLGTYPPSKGPAYCTHACGLAGGHRGFRHGGPPSARSALLLGRAAKQLTVKVLLNAENHRPMMMNGKTEHMADLNPQPSSVLKSFLLSDRRGYTFDDHVNQEYGPHHQFVHYEATQNDHFDAFGKQELGTPEPVPMPAPPKTFFFNPLLYRSRISKFERRPDEGDDAVCDGCRREMPASAAKNDNDDDFIMRSRNSLALMKMRREWYQNRKQNYLKNEIIKGLMRKYSAWKPSEHKSRYLDIISRVVLGERFPGWKADQRSKLFSLIDSLVQSAVNGGRQVLQIPAPDPVLSSVPLLPLYKGSS